MYRSIWEHTNQLSLTIPAFWVSIVRTTIWSFHVRLDLDHFTPFWLQGAPREPFCSLLATRSHKGTILLPFDYNRTISPLLATRRPKEPFCPFLATRGPNWTIFHPFLATRGPNWTIMTTKGPKGTISHLLSPRWKPF